MSDERGAHMKRQSMKKIMSILLCMLFLLLNLMPGAGLDAKAASPTPTIKYRTHVQTFGWQGWKENGVSGTTGLSKRLEAIQIEVSGVPDLGVRYRTHVQTFGWQDWKQNGQIAGTTGLSKRLEAIQIELTGEAASQYDIYYRVHIQSYGWLNWAKNGEMAGSQGLARRAEAIEIKILPKDSVAPTGSGDKFVLKKTLSMQAHCQTYGWMPAVECGSTVGTTGKGRRMEAIKISPVGYNMNVEYSVHMQGYGWSDYAKNGQVAGTEGQKRRLEAIKIRLTGTDAASYDVYYRAYVQGLGWLGWAKNDEMAGTSASSLRMEAIDVRVVAKGTAAPGSTAKPYMEKVVFSEVQKLAFQKLNQVGWNLQSAFNYSSSMPYTTHDTSVKPGYTRSEWYAIYGFTTGGGNCYNMAATFYQMAKMLGYEAYYVQGYLPQANGKKVTHGWVELIKDGQMYVCDPNFTYNKRGNGLLIKYGQPGTWRYTEYQRMD